MANTAQPITIESLLAHSTWAKRVAYVLTRDRDSADDLVQEAWISGIRRPPDTRGSTLSWLATVIRRRALDQARAGAARDRVEKAVAFETPVASPEDLVLKFDLHQRLATAVNALEEPFRATVLLRYFEGLPSSEIARRLELPAGTVRWRLSKALETLRAKFNTDDDRQALAALAPVFPGIQDRPTSVRPRWHVAVLALTIAGAAVVGTMLTTRGLAPKQESTVAESASSSTVAPAPPPHQARKGSGEPEDRTLLPAAAKGQDPCAGIPAMRQAVASAEKETFYIPHPDEIYVRFPGQNSKALEVLTPIIANLMKGRYPEAEPYTFECHEWACLLTVVHTPASTDERISDWMTAIQSVSMRARAPKLGFHIAGSVRDPVSGEFLRKSLVYMFLASPDGEPVGTQEWGKAFVPSFGPLPTDAVACRNEREGLSGRLAAAASLRHRRRPLDESFRSAANNPVLTLKARAEFSRIKDFFGQDVSESVECRGQICAVSIPAGSQVPYQDSWVRKNVETEFSGPDRSYLLIKPADQLAAEIRIRNTFRTMAPNLALTCATPSDEKFGTRFTRTDPAEDLTLTYLGTGVGSKFHICAAPKIEAMAAELSRDLPAVRIDTDFHFRPNGQTGPFE